MQDLIQLNISILCQSPVYISRGFAITFLLNTQFYLTPATQGDLIKTFLCNNNFIIFNLVLHLQKSFSFDNNIF